MTYDPADRARALRDKIAASLTREALYCELDRRLVASGMDEAKIQPALTAKEWEDLQRDSTGDDAFLEFPIPADDRSEYFGRPHEIAARCLYLQLFGFTREDLTLLREAIQTCASEWRMYDVEADVAKLNSLADRIEALLPPAT